MSEHDDSSYEYTEDFIAGLQWMWGDGYLSPGGPREIAVMLEGVDLEDRDVLDIGSGLGAIDVLLVEAYGAGSVVGIDVERPLVEHAVQRADRAGLAGRIRFELVQPGPLPFDDASFGVVFSKDAIIHVPDKAALYKEVLRVLEPGGVFVGSDWLRSGEGEFSEQAKQWFEVIGLHFDMKNPEQTRAELERAGFGGLRLKDRNEWYRGEITTELDRLSGDDYDGLARRIGADKAAARLNSSQLKQAVVERGELRPTHFVGYKAR